MLGVCWELGPFILPLVAAVLPGEPYCYGSWVERLVITHYETLLETNRQRHREREGERERERVGEVNERKAMRPRGAEHPSGRPAKGM